jgi:hypothetical protein
MERDCGNTYLERSDDGESFEHACTETCCQAADSADLAGLRICERGLKYGVGAHAQSVLERQVRCERGQSLPQCAHSFLLHDRRAAVPDSLVMLVVIQL